MHISVNLITWGNFLMFKNCAMYWEERFAIYVLNGLKLLLLNFTSVRHDFNSQYTDTYTYKFLTQMHNHQNKLFLGIHTYTHTYVFKCQT